MPYQHKEGPFQSDKNGRRMNSTWFQKNVGTNKFNRTWLVYSPSKSALYCFCCLLFPESTPNSMSSFEKEEGFKIWKDRGRLDAHETNSAHRRSFWRWKEEEKLSFSDGQIDDQLASALKREEEKWRQLLKRLLNRWVFISESWYESRECSCCVSRDGND